MIPFPDNCRIGDVFSMMVFGLDIEEFEYAYRLDGPWKPKEGLLFDKKHILLDPYAKAVTGQSVWGKALNTGGYRARVVRNNFFWGSEKPDKIPMEKLIIYEVHVRGFTKMDESALLAWLVRVALSISDELKNARNSSLRYLISEAKNIVHDEYADADLSLDTVCSKLGVSNSYFSSIFKKVVGISFITYLTDYRMQQAVHLMLETNEKNYEIAEHVGYEDANYFGYVFKRKYGMSPSKYRTEHMGK